MQTFTVEQLAYSMGYALAAWAAANILAFAISTFMFVSRRVYSFAALLSFFGLLPFILLPPVLISTGQPVGEFFGHRVHLVEFVLVVLACLFPAIESNSKEIKAIEKRYDALARAAHLSRWESYRQLAAPYLLVSLLAAATATLPMSILLAIIFEWARGGTEGLGGFLQGLVMQGTLYQRVWAIGVIGLCAGVLFLLAHGALSLVRKRFAISHSDGDGMADGESTSKVKPWLSGLAAGAIAYIALWWVILSNQPHEALRMTPPRFLELLSESISGDTSRVDMAVFGEAILRTLALSLGASVGGILVASLAATAAHQSRVATSAIYLLSFVTQSVPIFVLIPFALYFLREPWAAAIVVVASVTFFQGYRLLIEQLRSAPKAWMELIALGGDSPGRTIRRFMSFYGPFFWHYGLAALICIAPTGVIAALVADLFLGGINGIAWYGAYQGRTDLFAALLVINLALIL